MKGGKRLVSLYLCVLKITGLSLMPFCIRACELSRPDVTTNGKSLYARRRRAVKIGRCHRCYRVFPPIGNSKCDNKTCKPGISYNYRVRDYIVNGTSEETPFPGYNL